MSHPHMHTPTHPHTHTCTHPHTHTCTRARMPTYLNRVAVVDKEVAADEFRLDVQRVKLFADFKVADLVVKAEN